MLFSVVGCIPKRRKTVMSVSFSWKLIFFPVLIKNEKRKGRSKDTKKKRFSSEQIVQSDYHFSSRLAIIF